MNVETQASIIYKVFWIVVFGLMVYVAVATMPMQADPCSPRAIERYTESIIAYKDCLALDNCVVDPAIVQNYNGNQESFDACVKNTTKEK